MGARGLGSAPSSLGGSGAEPQPPTIFMHFKCKRWALVTSHYNSIVELHKLHCHVIFFMSFNVILGIKWPYKSGMARNRLGHTTRNSGMARAITATPLPPPMKWRHRSILRPRFCIGVPAVRWNFSSISYRSKVIWVNWFDWEFGIRVPKFRSLIPKSDFISTRPPSEGTFFQQTASFEPWCVQIG